MAHRVTIRDVAKEAGLSVATVSGALNGAKGYAKETVRSIWEVAARLNYTPHASARALQAGGDSDCRPKTSIVMHICSRSSQELKHPCEEDAAIACSAMAAQKKNYFTVPYTYCELDGFCCPPLLNGYVDGALIGTPHIEVVRLVSAKVPTVLMDVPFSLELANVPMVNGDWNYGAFLLLNRLRELGHRNAALLQPYIKQADPDLRHIVWGFRRAAEEQKIRISGKYSFAADFYKENDAQMTVEFAKHVIPGIRSGEITAIFAPHVSYVAKLMPVLAEAGIRIPDDVSLCGPEVSIGRRQDAAALWLDRMRIFDTAMELLDNMISGKKQESCEILLKPQLLENATIGPAAKHQE